MATSKIRQYLDDLERRAEAAVVREPLLPVLPTKLGWEDKRTGLTAKRGWLSKQFDAAPNNIRLGVEIKGLDDQIAECTEHMRLEQLGG
jgi:hypothetical protein